VGPATEQVTNAVLADVEAGRIRGVKAERLVGQMTCDALGMPATSDGWRAELMALEIPGELIDVAQRELRRVEVRVGQPPLAAGDPDVDAVIADNQVLGEPAGWPAADRYHEPGSARPNDGF